MTIPVFGSESNRSQDCVTASWGYFPRGIKYDKGDSCNSFPQSWSERRDDRIKVGHYQATSWPLLGARIRLKILCTAASHSNVRKMLQFFHASCSWGGPSVLETQNGSLTSTYVTPVVSIWCIPSSALLDAAQRSTEDLLVACFLSPH
jgi:hypothetical protein